MICFVFIIRKIGTKYVLYSRKKVKGKRRRLGAFRSKAAVLKREKQIAFFKHRGKG